MREHDLSKLFRDCIIRTGTTTDDGVAQRSCFNVRHAKGQLDSTRFPFLGTQVLSSASVLVLPSLLR